MRYMVTIIAFVLATGCAADGGARREDSRTYNVRTSGGDRVTVRLDGDTARGFDYRALLRRVGRTDLDSLDRQGILDEAMRTVMQERCAKYYKQDRVAFVSNFYERIGHFICTGP